MTSYPAPMSPHAVLEHLDQGREWPHGSGLSLDAAYAQALQVRQHRIARGELPKGYKVGFTNRTIWPRYNVFAPIWGTVWDTTLTLCEGESPVTLARTCQPRLEPEVVFGLKAAPPEGASLDDLFHAIDWVAPGFEVVQSHLPDWKFEAPDTVADGGLHAHLLVGRQVPVRELADNASALDQLLAKARVKLFQGEKLVEEGLGANVLDSPLRALLHFTQTLRACPGAPALQAGDLITTGTWTDAWPVQPSEHWTARFSAPIGDLSVRFTA
jgi:2-keto-4-pentenoate hydratase